MAESLWATIGTWVGEAFNAYALALVFACLGPALLLLIMHVVLVKKENGRDLRALLELAFGFANPVVYLVVFQPGLFRSSTPALLEAAQWVALLSYWGLRVFGAQLPVGEQLRRSITTKTILAGGVVVGVTALRDLAVTVLAPPDVNALPLAIMLVVPLYAFPLWIAFTQLVQLRAETTGDLSGFFFRSLAATCGGGLLAASAFLSAILASSGQSAEHARAVVLGHRLEILRAAEAERIDARTLAAIVAVTHRDHLNRFKLVLEEATAHAWLTDPTSHTPLAGALDPSLGIAQVKPVTALTAIWISRASQGNGGLPSKHYRDVPVETVRRFTGTGLRDVASPEFLDGIEKPALVQSLLDSEKNLRTAAFLLNLYARQWDAAAPGLSIRERPEILATLYQLGFAKSQPHGAPQANAFGRAVLREYEADWLRAAFPE